MGLSNQVKPPGVFSLHGEGDLTRYFYRQMYGIRHTEEMILDLFSEGLLTGTTHTSIGQEACAVGVISALDRSRDCVFSNHRGHGHFLSYCGDIEGLLAELMGRATGVSGGVGGSQQLHTQNFFSVGILGGTAAMAAGVALGEKLKGSGSVTVVFLGDGAFGEGVVYESLNIAALWSLPILYVCEHNQYAQSTPTELALAGDVASRATSFGIAASELVVRDVFEVYSKASELVSEIRDAIEPRFLLLETYRLAPHSKGDDNRSPEEIEKYRQLDPLLALEKKLPAEVCQQIQEDIQTQVGQAIAAAKDAPRQTLQDFLSRIDSPGST